MPQGCISQDPANCASTRGGPFKINESSTWYEEGLYNLKFKKNLGFNGNGDFGLDTLTLGFPGTGAPILAQQVVAGIAAKDFYLGYFGLGPEPTNLTALNNSR